jgi:hypothetical protein
MIFTMRTILVVLLAVLYNIPAQPSLAFSFSTYESNEANADQAAAEVSLTKLHCPSSLKSKKIAIMIGENHRDERPGHYRAYTALITVGDPDWDRRFGTRKSVYGPLVEQFNQGFHQLGLKTFSAAEINDQIAREEQEAFLNDDLDAAMTASERLQADYILKGIISTLAQTNKSVKVDELFITISLSLVDTKGNQVSTAQVSETTFSDADIMNTVHKMVNKRANAIIAKLFAGICKGGQ